MNIRETLDFPSGTFWPIRLLSHVYRQSFRFVSLKDARSMEMTKPLISLLSFYPSFIQGDLCFLLTDLPSHANN